MDVYYDETPLENQEYNLRREFIELNETENLTPEQCCRLDILHHGTEEQIKQLAKIN